VSRTELSELYAIASMIAPDRIRDAMRTGDLGLGSAARVRLEVSDEIDAFVKRLVGRDLPAMDRKITDNQIRWVDALVADGSMALAWTRGLFQNGDSREPEVAGLRAALVGTAMTLSVTLALAFPLGVLAAIYLEEFAARNRWTSLVEVNINNLAAVPSVIFGLLGLAVLLNVFGMPRSSPLVGGVVLALMTLPTLIIAARAAIAAVPSSIREAAMAVGASEVQVVLHHVVPLAMPGILTGAIIGMARALGETAPLLMIGMVAFIVDVPRSLVDAATVLPVQIFIWADSPEKGFVGRTAAATLVLLMFLIAMNASAVILRRRFEKRW
jgi:phosphate transport system permease protein